jgi:Predicted nucleoside-diphosphate-sugar epimerases
MNNVKPILVTGATGYVSGRLIPLLLADGYKVKAMGRSIPKMQDRPWGQDQNVELVKGDIQDVESLKNAAKRLWYRLLSCPLHDLPKRQISKCR